MKIALIGDSTTETYYLRLADNAALGSAPWNKTAGYDFSLGPAIASYMATTETFGNFGRGGFTTTAALTQNVSYVTGVYGSPVTTTAPMWTAAKAWSPDVVVMSFGINDQAYSDFATFSANIATIIADCVSLGIRLVVWNGAYFYYSADDSALGATHRTNIFPFFDELMSQADTAGFVTVDTRALWQASVTAGTWDLFAHNDSTYLAAWENGTSAPADAFYQNVHQWLGGQEIVAAALADALSLTATAGTDSIDLAWSGTGPYLIERRVV